MTNEELKAYMKHIGRLQDVEAIKKQMKNCEDCRVFKKMKELEKGLEDLEDTLNDAYTLNDFCLNKVILNQPMSECECIAESFSLKVMQNSSWLLGVIKGSDENEES